MADDSAASGAVVWYFDVVSPFSYLALPAVEALSRRRRVLLRPIVFGAVLAHWGQLGPAEIEPKRLHTYRLCQFMAESAGVPMCFPPRHPFRSLNALRLLAALDAEPGAVRAAFEFVWAEGRDPGDQAEREALCARLGVGDYDALVAERGAKDRLRAWTDGAIAAGVFGVPTLAVGDALFWGVDAMPMAERYLDDPGLLARGEMARLAGLPVGVRRGGG
jgi:2-hydroxychromene-2-carboxylate isomerase